MALSFWTLSKQGSMGHAAQTQLQLCLRASNSRQLTCLLLLLLGQCMHPWTVAALVQLWKGRRSHPCCTWELRLTAQESCSQQGVLATQQRCLTTNQPIS
jgi:hypothetical protein